jgi:chromosome segregation ATPase
VEPDKDIEKTRDAYRFRLAIEGGKSREIPFREQRIEPETMILANIQSDQIRLFVSQKNIAAKTRQALTELAAMQEGLSGVRQERQQREQQVKAITDEQNRIRENMRTVARNSDSYAMWERKLVQQEKDLDRLNMELEKLRADEQARNTAIARFLAELNVE